MTMKARQTMNPTLEALGGCWPTTSQELLLKAALLRDDDARAAWKEWMSRVDIERLDTGSYRVLPLLYRRLNELGIENSEMKRLKGVYRYAWCKNQILFHNMSEVLQEFNNAGIKTMVLKGAALVLVHYGDYGLRPMDDCDVLVPTEKATEAINLLKKIGFVPVQEDSPETILQKRHSTPFRNDSGFSLDLHWHIFEDPVSGTDDSDFWDVAKPIQVNGVATCVLCPTDEMLLAFEHGIKWNRAPPFRWVADVMAILKTSEKDIDWDRLVVKAREFRFILPVRNGLEYMRKEFGVVVPKEILTVLHEEPVSKKELNLYDVRVRPYNKYGRNRILYIWEHYQRYLVTEEDGRKKVGSFFRFIKKFWNLEEYWKIPFYAIGKALRRVYTIRFW
jgi:Uncharacterised nucleotidyltransferase